MQRLVNRPTLLRRIFLMALLAPFIMLWGEIFTRVLLPQNLDSKMNIFQSDPVIGFTYKPHAKTYEKGREYNALYQINSLGLRDREYGPKEKGIFRVLLLGDSFSVSHGLPIEDSFSKQLEKYLQAAINSEGQIFQIEVINAAVGGYSPYNYWKAYSRWAPVFNPDLVVVGLSPDDYDCSNEYAQYLIEDGEILAVFNTDENPKRGGGHLIRKMRKWLSWNSEFYVLMRNYFYYNNLVGDISVWIKSNEGIHQNSQLQQFLVPQPESMNEAWMKAFSFLLKLKKDTSTDCVPLVLVPWPLKLEIDSEYSEQITKGSNLTPQKVDFNQPLKMIQAFCKKEKIPVLDPRPAIRDRHAKVPCYFVYDGHLIAEGIRSATISLVKQWREMKLPP